jgi:GT2 family glycosyltransferase
VSIVVPTRARPEALRRCLRSLLAQRPAGICEIVVVDDSERGTADLPGLSDGVAVAAERSGAVGPAAARNVGIRRATADIVALTDDDCEVPAGWAVGLADAIERTGCVAIGGRVEAAPGVALPGRISQAITNGFARAVNADAEQVAFLTSNNVAYRKRVILEAGLFDEEFRAPGGEERELHARLRARGGCLGFAPEIVVRHHLDLDWAAFARQQVRYGRGARLLRRRFGLTVATATGLPAHVYARALATAVREAKPAERAAVAVSFAVAQALVAWGFLLGPERR